MRVIVEKKLVVGYWELVPMESGADNSSDQDTDTVTNELEELVATLTMPLWWKEENWPTLKKALERQRNPDVNGVCYAACLELDDYLVPQMTFVNCFQRIGSKPIKSDISFLPRNQALLLQSQVKHVE